MSNLQVLLRSTEELVQIVEDPELRKIAFQEILRHALGAEEAPESRPQRGVSADPRPSKKRATPATKQNGPAVIRPEVANLDLSPDQPGLVSWATLSTDWKKFCWVLEGARLKKLDGLTNSEISYLIDKIFRESFKAEVVNNLKVQIKRGMVKPAVTKSGDREYRIWKILAGGIKEVTAKSAASAE